MIAMFQRNMKIFFRDRGNIIFSLMGVLIIVGLYVLFLRHMWLYMFNDIDGISQLVDEWVIAGILSIVSVTTTLGSFGILVNDKSSLVFKDMYSSPVSRLSIVGGYVMCACVIGLLMSILALVLGELSIVVFGGNALPLGDLNKTLAMLILVSLTNTAKVMLITSFFSSSTSYSSASGLIGTFIGFIAGVYMPIGMFPIGLRTVLELTPVFHASAVMRNVVMQHSLSNAFAMNPALNADDFKSIFGINVVIGNWKVPGSVSIAYLLITAAVCILITTFRLSQKKI